MTYQYLVTTKGAHHTEARSNNSRQQIMIGEPGTWRGKTGDYLINNRRHAGQSNTLLLEVSDEIEIEDKAVFIAHDLTAATCAVAAWLQVLKQVKQGKINRNVAEIVKFKLMLISYQSDSYCLPIEYSTEQEYSQNYRFSRQAEAAFFEEAEKIRIELDLPVNDNLWPLGQKLEARSTLFERYTKALLATAEDPTVWPGQNGEGRAYLERYKLAESMFCDRMGLYNDVAILDARGFNGCINPRHLIEWARQFAPLCNMTLTVQDRSLNMMETVNGLKFLRFGDQLLIADPLNPHQIQLAGFNYKLGFIPMQPKPAYSYRGVWDKLAEMEARKRELFRIEAPLMGFKDTGDYSGYTAPVDGYLLTIPEITAAMRFCTQP